MGKRRVEWTREQVLPLIADAMDIARRESRAGRFFAKRQLCGDLFVLYGRGLDTGDEPELLPRDAIGSLGVGPDELHQAAIGNLRETLDPPERHAQRGIERLLCGGRHEASLLLFDELWEGIAEDIAGEIVASVPARAMLVFTGTAVPGGVERVRAIAEKAVSTGPHPISSTLLRWTGGGWDVWRLAF